jgi:hypothetical protein
MGTGSACLRFTETGSRVIFHVPVCWFNKLIACERGSSGHNGWPKTQSSHILLYRTWVCTTEWGKATCTVHGAQDFHPWEEFRTGFGDLSIRRDTPEYYYYYYYCIGRHQLNRTHTPAPDNRTHNSTHIGSCVFECACVCVRAWNVNIFHYLSCDDECGLVYIRRGASWKTP